MTKTAFRTLLPLGLAAAVVAAGCGGGGGDGGASNAAALIALQQQQQQEAQEEEQRRQEEEARANEPLTVYIFMGGEGVGYGHLWAKAELTKAGAEVASIECRAPAQSGWDPDFPAPAPAPGAAQPGGGSGPWLYFVAEIRARDLPEAEKLGFRAPLSQRVLKSTAFPCPVPE